MPPLRILVLCNRPIRENARTVIDHIQSFRRYSRHLVMSISFLGELPRGLRLEQFDVLVLHYSIVAALDSYLNPEARDRIAGFRGLKVQFIQDEYRFVNATVATMRRLGIDLLFTCVPEGEVEKVYSTAALPQTKKISVLTGYVPEGLLARRIPPIAARPIDVGYRSRQLPFWLGELGTEKSRIADGFLAATQGTGLICDISHREESRLYGERWVKFLMSCKAVLGSESGASVFDFTGVIQKSVEAYVEQHPDAPFEEVQEIFFAAEEHRIRLNQISPRCFEAAALGSAMVLFEGDYSGVLQPWRHFVPLRKDFGNMDEVHRILRDPAQLQEYADRAFREVAQNPSYSYAAFVRRFDDAVEEEYAKKPGVARTSSSSFGSALQWRVLTPFLIKWQRVREYRISVPFSLEKVLYRLWVVLPPDVRQRLRPFVRSVRARLTTPLRIRN